MTRKIEVAFADLARALAPLGLPLVGIVLIAAFGYGPIGFVAAFAILGGIVTYVAHRLAGGIRQYFRVHGRWTRPWALIALVTLTALVVIPSAFYIAENDNPKYVDGYERWSDVLVWAAFSAWFFALLLRLPSFASTLPRRIFTVVLLACFARYFAGIAVGGDTTLDWADHIVWPVLLVVVLIAASIGVDSKVPDPGGFATAASSSGVVLAIVATLAFVFAAVIRLASDPPSLRTGINAQQLAGSSPALARPDVSKWIAEPDAATLVERFSPVLELTAEQRWTPTSVFWFLEHADLLDREQRRVVGAPLTLADLRAGCTRPPCSLTINCSLEQADEQDCEGANRHDEDRAKEGADLEAPTAYVRVVRKQRQPNMFPRIGPYADQLEVLVQYWLFYTYDDWQSRILFGRMRQSHEGDWEAVTIGFSRTHPLFVAMTAHCGGSWVPWRAMRIHDPESNPDEYHPLVAVAEGSQANYHVAGADIASNWLDCANAGWLTAAHLGYRIHDRTGASDVVTLDALHRLEEMPLLTSFRGRWGRNGEMHFEAAFGRRHPMPGNDPDGPKTPSLQHAWTKPIPTFFDSGGWKARGQG